MAGNGSEAGPELTGQQVPAVVVPAGLWVQIMDLLRDTPFPHKQIDPILQVAGQLQPQQVDVAVPAGVDGHG